MSQVTVKITTDIKQPVDIQIGKDLWLVYDFPGIHVQKIDSTGKLLRNIKTRPTRYFVTDYASFSIRLAYDFFTPRDDNYDVAAGYHDYFVRNRKRYGLSLWDCHDIFNELMKLYGTPTVPRVVMYNAVRGFNWMCAGSGDGSFRYVWKEDELRRYYEVQRAIRDDTPIIDYNGERVDLEFLTRRATQWQFPVRI